jgi:RNA polymerase-binding transcription factor DksA
MNSVNGGANNKERRMSENKQDLLDKKQELEERMDRIKKDISGGLNADFAEQATQLENRDVLLEILRVSEEELQSTRGKLAALE